MFLVLCIVIDKISFTKCVKKKEKKPSILKMTYHEGLPVIDPEQMNLMPTT